MARPTRMRRPPLRFANDDGDDVVEPKSARTSNKIAEADGVDGGTTIEAAAPKLRPVKGNLLAGKRAVVARRLRSPVLRDRTNLPEEPLKVDILVKKKGADGETAKKTAKTTRQTAKSTAIEEVQGEAEGRAKSLRQTRAKNLPLEKENLEKAPQAKTNTNFENALPGKLKANSENAPLSAKTKANSENVPLPAKTRTNSENEPPTKTKTNSEIAPPPPPAKTRANSENAPPPAKTKSNSEIASPVKPKARNARAKEEARNAPAKETPTSAKAAEEARDVQPKEKVKRRKGGKPAAVSDDQENSLVIESENIADVDEARKVRAVRSGPRRIGKRVASSRPSTSRQSGSSVGGRKKKSLGQSPKAGEKRESATKSEVAAARKFFKSKAPGAAANESGILTVKKSATSKRRKIGEKPKPRVSTSFRLRQTTLSESFAKQALKRALRPRAAPRNYRELTIVEKTAASEDSAPKGPVYRTAKLSGKSDDDNDDGDGSEIYEFHFDRNDSREKRPTKRKRKVGVLPRKTRARAPSAKKTSAKPKATRARSATELDKSAGSRVEVPAAFDVPAIVVNDFEQSSPPVVTMRPKVEVDPQAQRVESPKSGPKVLQSVELTGENRIELTSTPQLTKSKETTSVRPSRATCGRPTVQYKTMLKHVLLNRSLSPIKKALENFDPGSPWRPPEIAGPQFSRVKNVVQSTPHVRKFSAMLENKTSSADASTEPARMNKIVERDESNENATRETSQKSPLRVPSASKSPRKFGTVISNMNVSSPANIASPAIRENSAANASHGSPQKIENVASPRPVDTSYSTMSCDNNDNEAADKENSVPTLASPRKAPKSPKKLGAMRSPLRAFGQPRTTTAKENLEPQPGPSGLQKRSPLGESRILKQSNLNNFLNIDQLPTSTRITSAHGIFADAHSTPIAGKPVRTIAKEANVENAFGFDDLGDSDIELSPIKNSLLAERPAPAAAKKIVAKRPKIEEKSVATVPTRLSVGEIKKHLRPVVAKDKAEDDPVRRIEAAERENREGKKGNAASENEKIGDKDTFSDTFDVLTAAQENAKETTVEEIPLFADLEPVHFKQPPRHSYKRKRVVAFNFSEDEEDDADTSLAGQENRGTKKRKVSKVEKQRLKKVEEWAKNLNNTFEEIDHFELVVE